MADYVLYTISSILQLLVYYFTVREMLGFRKASFWLIPWWAVFEFINHITVSHAPAFNPLGYFTVLFLSCAWTCGGSPRKKLFCIIGYTIMNGISEILMAQILLNVTPLTLEQLQDTDIHYIALLLSQMLVILCVCTILPWWKRAFTDSSPDFANWSGIIGISLCCFLAAILLAVEMILTQRSSIAIFIVALLLAAINILSYYFCMNISEKNRLEAELRANEQQLQSYREWAESTKQVRQQVNAFRHDMNNHLSAIYNLCAKDSTQTTEDTRILKIQDYLKTIGSTYDRLQWGTDSGNPVMDSIIDRKKSYASTHGIQMKTALNVPAGMKCDSMDLVILLGNILDNSVEACETLTDRKESQIRLQIEYSMGNLAMYITNSYDGHLDGQSGSNDTRKLPKTTKQNHTSHGIGMQNICATVDKYQGTMNWAAENEVFSLSILLYGFAK